MNNQITNILLSIIAVLLLVIVIQNFNRAGPSLNPHASMPMGGAPMAREEMPSGPPPMSGGGSEGQPMGGGDVPHDHGDPAEFHPTAMIFGALVCPDDSTLTLADQGCSSSEADKRRKTAETAFNQGLPIPKIFDAIIAKFGEKALTHQAIEIRRSRRAK